MSLDDKPWTETSSPMTRREIEDARAHLKAWFPNQSVERHTFNKLCDQAVRAVSAPPEALLKPATVRNNPDDSLDELFAEPCQFHIEQMASDHWWIGVNAPDKFFHINLHASGRIKANVEAEPRHEAFPSPLAEKT